MAKVKAFNKRRFDEILSSHLNKGRISSDRNLSDNAYYKLFKSAYRDTYKQIIEAVKQYEAEYIRTLNHGIKQDAARDILNALLIAQRYLHNMIEGGADEYVQKDADQISAAIDKTIILASM